MTELNSAPVTLPAGSFDYSDLKKGVEKAAKGSAKNYSSAVDKAIEESRAVDTTEVVTGAQLGYVMKDVKHPELDVTETVQVYDPALGEKLLGAEPDPAPTVATEPNNEKPAPGAATKE